LVETSKYFVIIVTFALAALVKLIFCWSLHWWSCHCWWEPPKTFIWLLCCYLHHLERRFLFPQGWLF